MVVRDGGMPGYLTLYYTILCLWLAEPGDNWAWPRWLNWPPEDPAGREGDRLFEKAGP